MCQSHHLIIGNNTRHKINIGLYTLHPTDKCLLFYFMFDIDIFTKNDLKVKMSALLKTIQNETQMKILFFCQATSELYF